MVRQSSYFREYYAPLGLHDEIGYLVEVAPNVCAHLSLGRANGSQDFSRNSRHLLSEGLPTVKAGFEKVWKHWAAHKDNKKETSFSERLSMAFLRFGTSRLTEREAEITQLLLKGHTPIMIAELTDITPGTVRNHLKNVYLKLDVSSQAELFGLLLEALSNMPDDYFGDPLVYFENSFYNQSNNVH